MAKCEKRQIKVELPPPEYVLTLTEDEAKRLLRALFRTNWGGDGIAQELFNLLSNAGVASV